MTNPSQPEPVLITANVRFGELKFSEPAEGMPQLANGARVARMSDIVWIDFGRIDPFHLQETGVVDEHGMVAPGTLTALSVARIALPIEVAIQLHELLGRQLADFAVKQEQTS